MPIVLSHWQVKWALVAGRLCLSTAHRDASNLSEGLFMPGPQDYSLTQSESYRAAVLFKTNWQRQVFLTV